MGYLVAELALDIRLCDIGILDSIVQESRRHRLAVHAEVCENRGYGYRVDYIRLAGLTELVLMMFLRHIIGVLHRFKLVVAVHGLYFFVELVETVVKGRAAVGEIRLTVHLLLLGLAVYFFFPRSHRITPHYLAAVYKKLLICFINCASSRFTLGLCSLTTMLPAGERLRTPVCTITSTALATAHILSAPKPERRHSISYSALHEPRRFIWVYTAPQRLVLPMGPCQCPGCNR